MRFPLKRVNKKKRRDRIGKKNLTELGELRLIQEIKNRYAGFKGALNDMGIGDDCALIRTSAKSDLLVTTDTQMEGVHFISNLVSPELIGEKSVAITLSDIAAMGGQPRYLFLNLGLPKKIDEKYAFRIMSGVHKTCKRYRVSLLGGDTFRSSRGTVLCLMALGKVSKGKAICRTGAKLKDEIFLTGTVGASALGLALLKKGWQIKAHHPLGKNVREKEFRESQRAIQRHCQPQPHLEEGRFFSQGNLANAMIDISDGLSSDLYNLCQASRVGAVIYESSVPFDQTLLTFVRDRRKALKMALSGGEDYCLLLTIPGQKSKQAVRRFQRKFSRQLFKIGEIVPKKEGIHLVSRRGKMRMLSRSGYEHFRKSFHATGLSLGSF